VRNLGLLTLDLGHLTVLSSVLWVILSCHWVDTLGVPLLNEKRRLLLGEGGVVGFLDLFVIIEHAADFDVEHLLVYAAGVGIMTCGFALLVLRGRVVI